MQACLRGGMGKEIARFAADRVGQQATGIAPTRASGQPSFSRRVRRLGIAAHSLRATIAGMFAYMILGREGSAALREGTFRRSGEVHRWMYDRYSLVEALTHAGFIQARRRAADDSDIPDFPGYGLETVAGRPRKPDSLYVEARKPRSA